MKRILAHLAIIFMMLGYAVPTNAETGAAQTAIAEKADVVLRALQDEMARSMKRLKLNEHSGPYFISYTVRELDGLRLSASLGALTDDDRKRERFLTVDVREGNYSLDSSNFSSNIRAQLAAMAGATGGGEELPIDDDYDAIRHKLWLRTDSAYKTAIENLDAKKNYLEQNNVRDKPDDMSKEEPVVSLEQTNTLKVNKERWAATIKTLSAVFQKYPSIQRSQVTLNAVCGNNWFINSEGTRCRETLSEYELNVMAGTQANDGLEIADSRVFTAYAENELPSLPELEKAVKAMADKITNLQSAPLADEYRGPIILEGQAAAELISQLLCPNLGNAQESLGTNSSFSFRRNQWKDSLGKRVLPQFITVTDDPLAKEFQGKAIFGGYKIDDDGVRAQRVVLIDKGMLKTFCMSRIPTADIKHSNGHSDKGIGESNVLFIESDLKLSPEKLKEKLIQLGKDAGLKSVMIARRLSTYDTILFDPASILAEAKSNAANGSSGGATLRAPLFLYTVSVDDGHEELVRGAQFSSLSLRIFRDISATGDDVTPYLVWAPGDDYKHLVTPSILIDEVELRKPEKETEKLPVLLNPYAEK